MIQLSLATITRVDNLCESGKVTRRGDLLYFHSEAERLRWVRAVARQRCTNRDREQISPLDRLAREYMSL